MASDIDVTEDAIVSEDLAARMMMLMIMTRHLLMIQMIKVPIAYMLSRLTTMVM